ncbi:MAG: galactose mutarotase [Bacteroidetes bacterium]|nr:galactose mutarotase [Bacteroidota bacterium]MDA1122410.1 galactose mutarotase [Bacteroidota bacterium]
MKKLIQPLLILLFVMIISCSSEKKETSQVSVNTEPFGKMPDGTEIKLFTLRNKSGIEVKVITYGGIITSIKVPDREGKSEDIVLGYDNLEGYLNASPYFGAIIGRYGNRIARGKFELDGNEYSLATNNMGNHLHGGIAGFDKVVWDAQPFAAENTVGVKLSYTSPDMEEGYPGKLEVVVTYVLNDDNSLTFEYSATTDKRTVVNLTNHSYYNLSGMKDDILNHELLLSSSQYLPVDSTLIPTEIASIEGTPFDFRSAKVIGKEINNDDIQLKNGGGYDHCWVLDESDDELKFAASVFEPKSGRNMEIFTTEPGIQFYTGNFLDGSINGKNGKNYAYRSGFCLETQHYPDSPNRPDFPSVVLNPGEKYSSKTITRFSTK